MLLTSSIFLNSFQPYEENEDVLVESACGKLLWNAKIVGVSQGKDSKKVNGYRVHYDEWSFRFDEWVDPFRVVEPVENNIEVQVSLCVSIPELTITINAQTLYVLFSR